MLSSPDGGIGRRDGFKIHCPKGRVGSSPTPGTSYRDLSPVWNLCGTKRAIETPLLVRDLFQKLCLAELIGEKFKDESGVHQCDEPEERHDDDGY